MIKTEADLAKLTARQREVLVALARQLSKAEVVRFSYIAEGTTNFDAAALLHTVEVLRRVVESKSAAANAASDPFFP